MRTVNLMEELHLHCTIESVVLRCIYTGKRFYALDVAGGGIRRFQLHDYFLRCILPWASSSFPHPHLAGMLRKGGFFIFMVLLLSFL